MNFDNELISRLLQRDELAFARFYEQSVDDFFRYVISHYTISEAECQDIVADVYVKIREALDKYDPTYSFGQYVRGILKNQCKDYYKKVRPLLFSEIGVDIEDENALSYYGEEDNKEQLSLFDFRVENAILQEVLQSLDQESQELIHARYILGYSYDTIADMYEIQVEAARQKISRIIKKLRSKLAHTIGED